MRKIHKTIGFGMASALLLNLSCTQLPLLSAQKKSNSFQDNKYAARVVTNALKPKYNKMTPKEYEADRQTDYRKRYAKLITLSQNRERFKGEVKIQLDTGIRNSNPGDGDTLDLTSHFNKPFSVKSVPTGNIVFQETFTKGKGNFEATKDIQINDTSKRYTLHIQKSHYYGGDVQVNINGTNVIKKKDFKHYEKEAENNTLLLNTTNSLRIRIKGNKRSSVTVTLVEGGESGTIRRRRGKLGHPGETHATHIKRNDTNIFNPNNKNSLGNLSPFSNEVSQDGQLVSTVLVNGTDDLRFVSGEVIARFESEQKKNEFMALYGEEVLAQVGPAYRIKLDLSKSPVNDFKQLLDKHEELSAQSIKSISFSSLSSMQTFAIVLDTALSKIGLVQQVSLNSLSKETPNAIETRSPPQPFNDWTRADGTRGTSWWLSDTRVPEAWEYSKGNGITAAVIDRGFATTPFSSDIDPRRMLINPPAVFGSSTDTLATVWNRQNETGQFHGTYVNSTGFGEADNNIGTTGVAPETKVMPIFKGNGLWKSGEAVKEAKARGVDLINMSIDFGDRPYVWEYVLIPFTAGIWLSPYWFFEDQLVSEPQIPFVISAGNDSGETISNTNPQLKYDAPVDYKFNYPQKLAQDKPGERFDFIIPIGAVQSQATRFLDQDNTKPSLNRVLNIGNLGPENVSDGFGGTISINLSQRANLQVPAFSNVGDELIWAPGEDIYIKDRRNNNTIKFNGTSAAAPFTAGVISLMLSRNSNLTPQNIEEILINTSRIQTFSSVDSTNSRWEKYRNVPMIDALDAVKAAGSPPYANNTNNLKKAQKYVGIVASGGRAELILPKSILTTSGIAETEKRLRIDSQTVSNSAYSNVSTNNILIIEGWTGLQAGRSQFFDNELEMMDLDFVCSMPSCSEASKSNFKPSITKATINTPNPKASLGFKMTFEGTNFIPKFGEQVLFRLYFERTKPASSTHFINIEAKDIEEISNDGTKLVINVPAQTVDLPDGESSSLRKGTDYKVQVISLDQFSDTIGSGSGGFTISSGSSSGGGGFNISSVNDTFPPRPYPGEALVWLTRNDEKVYVNPDDVIGIGIDGQDLQGLQIEMADENGVVTQLAIKDIANDHATFQLASNVNPGVKDIIIKLAGGDVTLEDAIEVFNLPLLEQVQQISTSGVEDVESFKINTQTYLAFANHYNGSTHNNTLDIQRWDGSTFVSFQAIPTSGASDSQFFTIGSSHYLAVANYLDDITTDINSKIYKWNGSQFVDFQSLPSRGGRDFEFFTANNEHYLMLANLYSNQGGGYNQNSVLYKWNGTQFASIQSIPTQGGIDWEHMEIEGEHYMVVANYTNGGTSQTSVLYKWNGTQLVSHQTFTTYGAIDWESFEMNGSFYLCLSNFANDGTGHSSTLLYKWNGTQFVVDQTFSVPAGYSCKHFEVNGHYYLLVGGRAGETTAEGIVSRLYRWNGTQFVIHQELGASNNAKEWEVIEVGDKRYLVAMARYFSTGSYNSGSLIFEFK